MYGIDYEETYSLVAKMTTVRAIIAMATTKGWSLHQMDVKKYLVTSGFQTSNADFSLYVKKTNHGIVVIASMLMT